MIRTPLTNVPIDQINQEVEFTKKKVRILSSQDLNSETNKPKTIVFEEHSNPSEFKNKNNENKNKIEELTKENQKLLELCSSLENEVFKSKRTNQNLKEETEKYEKELNDIKLFVDSLGRDEMKIEEDPRIVVGIGGSIIHQILVKHQTEEMESLRMSNEILLQQVKRIILILKSLASCNITLEVK
jgi:predicted nuclease with TOPRIM domain